MNMTFFFAVLKMLNSVLKIFSYSDQFIPNNNFFYLEFGREMLSLDHRKAIENKKTFYLNMYMLSKVFLNYL